jgi:hypothetical protein
MVVDEGVIRGEERQKSKREEVVKEKKGFSRVKMGA